MSAIPIVARQSLRCLLLLSTSLCLLGCESKGPVRIALQGKVTLAGKPIEKGNINISPAAGHDGVAASTAILKGHYQFTSKNGPSPGSNQVLIMEILPKSAIPDPSKITAGREPRWELEFDVPEQSPATKNFTID